MLPGPSGRACKASFRTCAEAPWPPGEMPSQVRACCESGAELGDVQPHLLVALALLPRIELGGAAGSEVVVERVLAADVGRYAAAHDAARHLELERATRGDERECHRHEARPRVDVRPRALHADHLRPRSDRDGVDRLGERRQQREQLRSAELDLPQILAQPERAHERATRGAAAVQFERGGGGALFGVGRAPDLLGEVRRERAQLARLLLRHGRVDDGSCGHGRRGLGLARLAGCARLGDEVE
mmetsp:Transcript_6630/g.22114  ORF Transcript_6630/g.22114 Transcript_6630/m.22114 type:complete len:244 (+) Transcript_6630:235-966(+)